jgi:hypothetical protein
MKRAAVIVLFALSASPALAQQVATAKANLIAISCDGKTLGTKGEDMSIGSHIFRFRPGTFQAWDAFSQTWARNLCADTGAICNIDDKLIDVRVAYPYGTSAPLSKPTEKDATVFEIYRIFRTDGSAVYIHENDEGNWQSSDVRLAGQIYKSTFYGNCKKSTDHIQQDRLF